MNSFPWLKTLLFALCLLGGAATRALAQNQPVDLVNPLVDAANSRWFFFNSATRPFGMVNQLIEKVYSGISPNYGYSGDEDQWLMGSLAVLLKTGLFSTNGGTAPEPFYEIGSPIFNKITIHLNPRYYKGKQFVIDAKNNSSQNLYIQSAQLNGKPLNRPWVSHDTVVNGGTLTLPMSSKPNKTWGSAPGQAPPSMSPTAK